jgi:hypothetical protein
MATKSQKIDANLENQEEAPIINTENGDVQQNEVQDTQKTGLMGGIASLFGGKKNVQEDSNKEGEEVDNTSTPTEVSAENAVAPENIQPEIPAQTANAASENNPSKEEPKDIFLLSGVSFQMTIEIPAIKDNGELDEDVKPARKTYKILKNYDAREGKIADGFKGEENLMLKKDFDEALKRNPTIRKFVKSGSLKIKGDENKAKR